MSVYMDHPGGALDLAGAYGVAAHPRHSVYHLGRRFARCYGLVWGTAWDI